MNVCTENIKSRFRNKPNGTYLPNHQVIYTFFFLFVSSFISWHLIVIFVFNSIIKWQAQMCKMPAVCFVVIQMHTHTHRRGTHVTHIATKLFQLDISYINVYTTTKFQHIIVIRHYHKMKIVDDYGDVWHIQADAKAVHEMQKSFEKCQEILDRPRRLFIKSIFLLQISTFFFVT